MFVRIILPSKKSMQLYVALYKFQTKTFDQKFFSLKSGKIFDILLIVQISRGDLWKRRTLRPRKASVAMKWQIRSQIIVFCWLKTFLTSFYHRQRTSLILFFHLQQIHRSQVVNTAQRQLYFQIISYLDWLALNLTDY